MSSYKHPYPQPREDRDNATFLAGWRAGKVVLQRCGCCGKAFFYPRPMCPTCWSVELTEEVSSGDGRIVSYSAIERPNDPAFNEEVPILLAEIETEEGATLLARIVECGREEVSSGLAVELPALDVARRYPLPVYRPARAARP